MKDKETLKWSRLIQEPPLPDREPITVPKQAPQDVDWSLLTQEQSAEEKKSGFPNDGIEKKSRQIRWSMLTKSST